MNLDIGNTSMQTAQIYKPRGSKRTNQFVAISRLNDGFSVQVCKRMQTDDWREVCYETSDKTGLFALLNVCTKDLGGIVCVSWDTYEMLCYAELYDAIENCGWSTKAIDNGMMICESPPTIIDIMSPNGVKIRFCDLANWGIRPNDISVSYSDVSSDDVASTFADYIKMLDSIGMGSLQTTAASQGFYAYRKSHMYYHLVSCTDEKVRSIERRSYHGGRAEAFRLGKLPGKVYHVDVKSMYTWLGLTEYMPTELSHELSHDMITEDVGDNAGKMYIAEVSIKTDVPIYPVQHDGILVYPVGVFETVLAGNELSMACAMGHAMAFGSINAYNTARIYTEWSEWAIKSRELLNGLGLNHLANAYKLAVNSSYGKIGARGRNWINIEDDHAHLRWGQYWCAHPVHGEPTQYRVIDGQTQYLSDAVEYPTSMPCISACMTSAGRMALWGIIQVCGLENVFYVDTDGLMVNQYAYDVLCNLKMIASGKPGKLVVREVSDDVEIFGIKHYRFGNRYCCASVPEFFIHDKEERPQWKQHQPFTYSLWHKEPFANKYTVRKVPKPRDYRHGHVMPNGVVRPWIMQGEAVEVIDANGQSKIGSRNCIVGYQA